VTYTLSLSNDSDVIVKNNTGEWISNFPIQTKASVWENEKELTKGVTYSWTKDSSTSVISTNKNLNLIPSLTIIDSSTKTISHGATISYTLSESLLAGASYRLQLTFNRTDAGRIYIRVGGSEATILTNDIINSNYSFNITCSSNANNVTI
jgi:hypothetical protein